MRYTVRPISDRTWLQLGREVEHLGGTELVIEVDVPERGIRNDGMLRADAKIGDPAVVVAFETRKHGPMLYRCDRYVAGVYRTRGDSWQHNVRAVALTLESLRAVDRYGATETGQQYAGFKALPAGRAMPATSMTRDQAIALLADHHGYPTEYYAAEPTELHRAWKFARAAAHPDRHAGDRTLWDQVEQAAEVLGLRA